MNTALVLNVNFVCICKSIPNIADDKIKELQLEEERGGSGEFYGSLPHLWLESKNRQLLSLFPMECCKIAIRRRIPMATDNDVKRGLHRADKRWISLGKPERNLARNLARKWRCCYYFYKSKV